MATWTLYANLYQIDYVFGVTALRTARGSWLQVKSKMVDSLAGFGSVQITDC